MMSSVTFPPPARDITRLTLAVLFIVVVIVANLWVLRPFIGATLWAATVVVATWPMMRGLESRLGGRRWIAVAVMTGAMLLLIVPVALAIRTIDDHGNDIVEWAKTSVSAGVPSPPEGVGQIPLVGARLLQRWQQLATADREELATQATPYARPFSRAAPHRPHRRRLPSGERRANPERTGRRRTALSPVRLGRYVP
jgi:predicted PurR-regulated permease PerM